MDHPVPMVIPHELTKQPHVRAFDLEGLRSTMYHVDSTAAARSVEAPFVITQRIEPRPFADAVLCVRVHRHSASSGSPIVVLRRCGGAFDPQGDPDEL